MRPNQPEQMLQTAQQHLAAGRLEAAKELLMNILKNNPNHVQALYSLGITEGQTGNMAEAGQLFEKLISLQPNSPEIYYNFGTTKMKQEKYQEAEILLTKALRLKPDFAAVYINLGHVQHKQGKLQEAEQNFQQALQLQPNNPLIMFNLGIVFQQQQQLTASCDILNKALAVTPDYVDALTALSQTYRLLSQQETALLHLRKALTLQPDNANILFSLAEILRESEHYQAACEMYNQTIEKQPSMASAYTNLGICLQALGKPHEAVVAYTKAYALTPKTEILGNRAQAILQSGNLALGFKEYEWRTKVEEQRPLFEWCSHKPRWQGEIFSGKRLLVHKEQGLGDTLQFVRYLPLVKQRGGIVILSVQKSMLRLLEHVSGIDYLIEHQEQPISQTAYDLAIPLMSLPAVFGTTLSTIPSSNSYINPAPQLVKNWKAKLAPNSQLKIGLVWAGNPNHTFGLNRTCGLAALAPLSEVPGITYYSLQIGEAGKEALQPSAGMNLMDLTTDITDFADTAALISQLDLVITVDTAVAHLAGAMGKPTWTLLPFASEWRWLVGKGTSPWYPTMRLFRQPSPGDWYTVIQTIQQELRLILATNKTAGQ